MAEVAAKVAVEGARHYGATYELSSGDCLSAEQMAQTISSAIGRPVKLVVEDVDQFLTTWFGSAYSRDRMASEYATFKALSDWYGTHDFVGNPNVLTLLLGRAPTTYRQYLEREYAHRDQAHRFAGTGTVYAPMQ